MLTEAESSLVRRFWSSGPAILIEAGFTPEDIKVFVERSDVQSELFLLDAELKQGAAIEQRQRFIARRGVSRLASGAAAVLGRAMHGPVYALGPNGNILRDASGNYVVKEAEMTPMQLRAAEIVLASVGATEPKAVEYRADVQLNVLLNKADRTVEIEVDTTLSPKQQALSRERVRNAIDILMARLPDVRSRVEQSFEGPTKTIEAKSSAKTSTAPSKSRTVKKKAAGGTQKEG